MKERIYEKKAQNRSVPKSCRLTPEEDMYMKNRIASSGMNQSDYMRSACLNYEITVITDAKELARNLHQFRTLISELPKGKITGNLVDNVSEQILKLMKQIK
jgi:hypothetical protein